MLMVINLQSINNEFLFLFMSGWIKHVLLEKDHTYLNCNLAGLTSVLNYYKSGMGINKNEYLDELAFLAETAGAIAVKRFTQKLPQPDTRTFVGKGKLEEIKKFIIGRDIELAIFDDELSGSQIMNVEKELQVKVKKNYSLIMEQQVKLDGLIVLSQMVNIFWLAKMVRHS